MVYSPCVSICSMDDESGYCKGCYRTRDEIANWKIADDQWRSGVLQMLSARKNAHQGFTLIEIALVMLGVALIVGGIAAGSNVVHQAALRKQMTQLEKIESGVQNFRAKYGCMPGDCQDPSVIDGYTYSGNGDGFLAPTWNSDENKGFWLHLSLSRMLDDQLVSHPAFSGMLSPRMKSNEQAMGNAYGNISYKRNVIEYAINGMNGSMSVTDIVNVDTKIDDGLATCGNIRSSGYGSGSNNVYSSDPTWPISVTNKGGWEQCVVGKVYNTSSVSKECNILYLLGE